MPPCRCCQEVNEQLPFAGDAIVTAVLPKPAQLCITLEPREKIISEPTEAVVSAESFIQRFRGAGEVYGLRLFDLLGSRVG